MLFNFENKNYNSKTETELKRLRMPARPPRGKARVAWAASLAMLPRHAIASETQKRRWNFFCS